MSKSGSHEQVSHPLPERPSPLVYAPLAPSSRTLARTPSPHIQRLAPSAHSNRRLSVTNPAISQRRLQLLSRTLVIESRRRLGGLGSGEKVSMLSLLDRSLTTWRSLGFDFRTLRQCGTKQTNKRQQVAPICVGRPKTSRIAETLPQDTHPFVSTVFFPSCS